MEYRNRKWIFRYIDAKKVEWSKGYECEIRFPNWSRGTWSIPQIQYHPGKEGTSVLVKFQRIIRKKLIHNYRSSVVSVSSQKMLSGSRKQKYIIWNIERSEFYMLVTWQMLEVEVQSHVMFLAKGLFMAIIHPRSPLQGSTEKSQFTPRLVLIFWSAWTVKHNEVTWICQCPNKSKIKLVLRI